MCYAKNEGLLVHLNGWFHGKTFLFRVACDSKMVSSVKRQFKKAES